MARFVVIDKNGNNVARCHGCSENKCTVAYGTIQNEPAPMNVLGKLLTGRDDICATTFVSNPIQYAAAPNFRTVVQLSRDMKIATTHSNVIDVKTLFGNRCARTSNGL